MPDKHDEHLKEQAVEAVLVDDASDVVVADAVEVDAEIVEVAEVAEEGGRPSVSDKDKQRAHALAKKAASDTDEESAKPARPSKPKKQRKPVNPRTIRRVVFGVLSLILILALVGVGLFCWQKWMRFDDSADIQGVWKVQSTGDTIVFNAKKLKLTKGIAYEYQLDTDQKTIAYSFGDLKGGGHYYFGADRQVLVIIDGEETLNTLAEVGFIPAEIVEHDDPDDAITVLSKVSDDTNAEPSGTATGVSAGAATGEREYVVQPEPSSSSSSEEKKSRSSRSDEDEESGEEREHRGFVDEDGDGYDDYTDLDYDEFMEQMADDSSGDEEGESDEGDEDSEGEGGDEDAESQDEYDDESYVGDSDE